MKRLFLPLIVSLALSTTAIANAPTEPSRIDKLALVRMDNAAKLFKEQHYMDSKEVVMKVLTTDGISNDVKASAFLLMGEIGMMSERYDVAELAYENTIQLTNIPEKATELAHHGLVVARKHLYQKNFNQ